MLSLQACCGRSRWVKRIADNPNQPFLEYPGLSPLKSGLKLIWLKQKRHSPAVLASSSGFPKKQKWNFSSPFQYFSRNWDLGLTYEKGVYLSFLNQKIRLWRHYFPGQTEPNFPMGKSPLWGKSLRQKHYLSKPNEMLWIPDISRYYVLKEPYWGNWRQD